MVAIEGEEFFTEARTAGRAGGVALPDGDYETFLFDHDDPVLTRYRGQRYDDYSRDRTEPSFVQELLGSWQQLYEAPFRGVTADGTVELDLYALPAHPLESAESQAAARAAAAGLLDALTAEQRDQIRYSLDARQWRAWSNPEFVIHTVGVRLEDMSEAGVDAVLRLVHSCLSREGYSLVVDVMNLNGFLGRLVDLPTVMSPRSYFVSLFGDPAGDGPWGWQLFGHHLAVNFVSVDGRHVVAPVFLGAEPALPADGRPSIFADREAIALELAASLTEAQRADAIVYPSVLDPAMPEGRVHPADERHVAGAFRDNRVVPYEGALVTSFSAQQTALLRRLTAEFLLLLPDAQRNATLADVDAHLEATRFAWYGATDGSQPFYFRIQSPVILAELDHHAGVWLTNTLPARFHVHTTLRLPNGNDYGRAYIAEWRAGRDEPTDPRWLG